MIKNKVGAIFGFTIAWLTILFAVSPHKVTQGVTPTEKSSKVAALHIREDLVNHEMRTNVSLNDVAKVIKKVKLQHPDIVLAQAIEESGHWTSGRFRDYNNMFGMKKAGARPTLASGYDQSGYAIYTDWKHSIYDYALYQSAFARGLSREAYFKKLESYAGGPAYIANLKQIIKDNHLRNIF